MCTTNLSHFTQIYEAYICDVYRYCFSRLGNNTDAEDITSETFLKSIENISLYKTNRRQVYKMVVF